MEAGVWRKICVRDHPDGVVASDLSADAPFDGECFVNYLRTCFTWGGFPGFRCSDRPGDNRTLKALK